MKILIINNLVSGLKTGAIHDFNRYFARNGDELCIRSTDGEAKIENMLHDAASFDLVVAAGGDATISTVAYELRNSDIPVLAFPAGTANLLATNLNTPDEPSALARIARALKTEYYDIGEMAYLQEGKSCRKGFAVIGGAGYDASIMRRAERLKSRFGPMAYFAAALSEPNPKVADFTIVLDDQKINVTGIAVLVINFAQIYPDLSITHGNDAQDGLFEVVILKKQHTVELLPALFAIFLDSMVNFSERTDALEIHHAKYVLVKSNPDLELQIDGEIPAVSTPFEARILPGAARFVVA
ncbi:MAG: NAD(+)/NADH kinase [Coriobacteriales bacterium]|jgi:diacylglycerol kinase family enzyme|nr:NAD(+)/NADH kinase [Coriobacteriales bacterium]